MYNRHRDLVVIDNFYKAPSEIREMALSLPYSSENTYGHFERTPSFFPSNIIEAFQELVGYKILIDENWLFPRTSDGKNLRTFNGTFYRVAKGKSPPNHVHHDCHDYTAIIYLTPNCPPEYGTLFYEYNATRSRKTTYPIAPEGDEISRKYGDDFSRWTCVDFVGNSFNRLVIFPSQRYHGARIANDSNIERICHLFLFNTVRS